eukprot:355995_1
MFSKRRRNTVATMTSDTMDALQVKEFVIKMLKEECYNLLNENSSLKKTNELLQKIDRKNDTLLQETQKQLVALKRRIEELESVEEIALEEEKKYKISVEEEGTQETEETYMNTKILKPLRVLGVSSCIKNVKIDNNKH